MMKWKKLVAVMLAAWGVSGCFEQNTAGKKTNPQFEAAFNEAKAQYEQEDYFAAYKAMSELAEKGYVAAQLETAQMLFDGKGVRRNESAAVDWLKKAVEQKDANALFSLGLYYRGGIFGRDYHQAFKLFSQAAEQKHGGAQFELGRLYEDGNGVRIDKTAAKEWFGKACDNGSQAGCSKYKILMESEK